MSEENKEVLFLENITKGIVDNPDSVSVVKEIDDKGVKLTLSVDPSDMGKVIGSQGRMATALRTIMHAYGGKINAHISVLVDEPK